MSQRVAGCCCDKSDCDGTTLGTCCITSSEADPNCFGTCEGWDQFDVYLGAITDTTTSACDTNLGLVVGVNPDGSDQIVARVLFTPNADCIQFYCICKENITCAECKRQNGVWQKALSCAAACGGSCCIKDSNGVIVRCIDVANECQCKAAASVGQTAVFTQGKNCQTTNCVSKVGCHWWKQEEGYDNLYTWVTGGGSTQINRASYTSYYCTCDSTDYSQFNFDNVNSQCANPPDVCTTRDYRVSTKMPDEIIIRDPITNQIISPPCSDTKYQTSVFTFEQLSGSANGMDYTRSDSYTVPSTQIGGGICCCCTTNL